MAKGKIAKNIQALEKFLRVWYWLDFKKGWSDHQQVRTEIKTLERRKPK